MNHETLQLLIDNELDAEERANTIEWLDCHPDRWRSVALELLHNQMLDGAVRQSVASEMVTAIETRRPQAIESRSRPGWMAGRLAAAACLALACGLAFWLGALNDGTRSVSQPIAEVGSNESAMTLAEALAKCATPIPDSFRREMLKAGYLVAEEQRLAEVQLPSGGTLEMPIRQFDVHFLGAAAFQ